MSAGDTMASFRSTSFPSPFSQPGDENNIQSNGKMEQDPYGSVEDHSVEAENNITPPTQSTLDLIVDVLIVGGGMSGMYAMWKFRKLGLHVKLLEAGSYFGGAWHWNRYPGARVDSETPYYGLSIPEVYQSWSYTERFPDHVELRKYFAHVDKTLDLAKDTYFNTVVTGAKFDKKHATWTVRTGPGGMVRCKYLILAVGSTYKMHIPEFKNMEEYKGEMFHSARCSDQFTPAGKKIACIGSGATGVQIVQALARERCQIHAYIRTPNIAIPMKQRSITKAEQDRDRLLYDAIYAHAKLTRSGFPYSLAPYSTWDLEQDARESFWEKLWEQGGIRLLVSNFRDLVTDKDANRLMYDFWARKVRARITNPMKRDILAPLHQPHWFGTKRPSLEHDYYECVDQENVTIVDLQATSIKQFTETGIELSDRHEDYDAIILATGYDSVTGSLTEMGLADIDGNSLKDMWAKGVQTYLGLTISGFPNMFMIYGPQSPISFANAPAIIETQVDWAVAAIEKMRHEHISSVDAQPEASRAWKENIQVMSNRTLYSETDSWYMGTNVPGKSKEQLTYLDGLNLYAATIQAALDGWQGFQVIKDMRQ
jgi:cation diffusion facilitator CzcD-associated flavoprotein CzcO